jgi:hypothetical protein
MRNTELGTAKSVSETGEVRRIRKTEKGAAVQ